MKKEKSPLKEATPGQYLDGQYPGQLLRSQETGGEGTARARKKGTGEETKRLHHFSRVHFLGHFLLKAAYNRDAEELGSYKKRLASTGTVWEKRSLFTVTSSYAQSEVPGVEVPKKIY